LTASRQNVSAPPVGAPAIIWQILNFGEVILAIHKNLALGVSLGLAGFLVQPKTKIVNQSA
jgi:hypothetical protein